MTSHLKHNTKDAEKQGKTPGKGKKKRHKGREEGKQKEPPAAVSRTTLSRFCLPEAPCIRLGARWRGAAVIAVPGSRPPRHRIPAGTAQVPHGFCEELHHLGGTVPPHKSLSICTPTGSGTGKLKSLVNDSTFFLLSLPIGYRNNTTNRKKKQRKARENTKKKPRQLAGAERRVA